MGTAEVALAVRSLAIGGRTYNVATDVEQRESERGGLGANREGRRTSEMVGGGALPGILLERSLAQAAAAIGAAAGAVGGAAVQVLTKGKIVSVPAKTVLTFRLDRSVRLGGYAGG
jgi:hypothetical protein